MNTQPLATPIARMVAWIMANPCAFNPERDDPARHRCSDCWVLKVLSEFRGGKPRGRCNRCRRLNKLRQRRYRARHRK